MEIISHSSNETIEIAKTLAQGLKGGEIILLNGDLGFGKTVFAKGIAKGLNITFDIVSPTFSILNIYHGTPTLCHYDCYRLSGALEAAESGLDEYFGLKNHVCVIEWADRIKPVLDCFKTISVNLSYVNETTRKIEIIGRDL